MMAHERIGDRADHPHRTVTETAVELVLEENHVGLAIRQRLVVHAVVSDQTDDGAQFDKAPHAIVDRPVERIRFRRSRRVRVLHIIRKRQIEQPGHAALEQRDPGIEHEQRQIGRIHVRSAAPDERFCVGVGAFGRKADAVEIAPEQLAQFVFGGDRRRPDAGLRHQR